MPNDERPKLSWREIDKKRQSSGGSRTSGAPNRPSAHEDSRQKQYRAALEAAFAKGELGKLADKLNITGLRSGASEEPPKPPPPSEHLPSGLLPAARPPSDPAAVPESAGSVLTEADAAPTRGAAKKKGGDDKLSLRRKLVEAISRAEISRAAEKYLTRFPMPDDHEFLEQLLDHEQEGRVKESIDRINQLIDRRQPPRRRRALCGKLRYLVETSSDDDLRQQAGVLLRRLG